MTDYAAFLDSKMPRAERAGFAPPSAPHPSLFPHQRDIATWAVEGGRRAVFTRFGTGKTRTHLQVAAWLLEAHPTGKHLIVAPLGVRQEFTREEGPAMGLEVAYCRTDAEVDACPSRIVITNYERVRDGAITIDARFVGVGLDEASVLRSFGSKTYQAFLEKFRAVPYRWVFTATPSPNRFKELIHYAGFLGVMSTGEALTRFFQRDSSQAGNLTLYPHMEKAFFAWLASWACFLQSPADLGYDATGYDLPPLTVEWHQVGVDHTQAWKQADSWGQGQMFLDQATGLRELAETKRDTIAARLAKACELIEAGGPDRHWILWHDLEAERHAIEKRLPECRTIYGAQDLETREDLILGFGRGEYRLLATKPILSGSGCNLQRHCSDVIFLGAGYKANDFLQAIHRVHRFQQSKPVTVHVIYAESEAPVVRTLKAKWADHDRLVARMAELIRAEGLATMATTLQRTRGTDRVEVTSEKFRAIRNDNVQELATWPDASVDAIVTSIPFGNQYEYSPAVEDFGHNVDNKAFFAQLDFLVPHLLRVLKPGRVAAIHVKDRIRFGNVTGLAMPTVDRFSDQAADCFERHGFAFMGRITIDTDVVRENAQTYRLGWSENAKDSTKMGVGMPEYVLLLRRLPSDLSNAYADTPVTKDKAAYTRADWQVDAAALWRSDGDRLPDAALVGANLDQLGRLWRQHCDRHGYDYDEHVALAKRLEVDGRLPASFMLFPPIAKHPDIWTDIARMRVLNSEQSRRQEEHHVCPLQLDVCRRLIRRYTNPGEVVLDPFAGIFTVPYVAIHEGRLGWGVELSAEYWRMGVGYCEQAEAERTMPTLFDLQQLGGGVVKDRAA